jgi:phytoene dehydrogenase-like protein
MDSTEPVVIVGAGLSGLSCARYLHDAGVSCVLLEASNAVGGRIRTDEIDGFRCDRGFQVLLTAYPEAQRQLDYDELQLRSFIPGSIIRRNGRFHRFVDPWRRPLDGLRSVFGGVGSFMDRVRVVKLRWRSTHGTITDIFNQPETTTDQALRGYGFTNEMIDGFFRLFFGGVFLERELQTSSRVLHFVFRMFSTGNAALPRNGMQAIPRQMGSRLSSDCVRLESPVRELSGTSVTLANGEQIPAAQVVLATDAATAAALLGETSPRPSRRVRCLYFSADQAPIAEPILILNGDGSGPINNLCVPSNAASDYAPAGQHLISVSVVESNLEDEALAYEVVKQATSWFGPSVAKWRLIKTYDILKALPDQLVGADAKPGHSVEKHGVIVCGDHIGNASIQSALESGRHAAERIVDSRRSAAT